MGITAGATPDLAGNRQASPRQPDARQTAARQPRVVKRAMSRYNAKGKVDRTTDQATTDIAILAAPLTPSGEP